MTFEEFVGQAQALFKQFAPAQASLAVTVDYWKHPTATDVRFRIAEVRSGGCDFNASMLTPQLAIEEYRAFCQTRADKAGFTVEHVCALGTIDNVTKGDKPEHKGD